MPTPNPPGASIVSGSPPDWAAGLPCLGAPSITFTSDPVNGPPSSDGTTTTAIPIGTLDPATASAVFESPSPGTLKYKGVQPARFLVEYQVIFTLTTDTSVALPPPVSAPLAFRVILTVLLLNGATVNSSAATEELGGSAGITSGFENVSTFNGHALLVLHPGDELEVGITDILAGFVGSLTDSGCVNALALTATLD